MSTHKITRQFSIVLRTASALAAEIGADALLVLLNHETEWKKLRELIDGAGIRVLVAADPDVDLKPAADAGLIGIQLAEEKSPLMERLQNALLEAVADEVLRTNCDVVAVYSGFEQDAMDSISILRLDDRLRRLTVRDLQMLESSVPLKTLKMVIDLAVQIGREGREGKKVGAIFIVGDTRKVLQHCKDSGFDPLHGYTRKMRNLHDPRVREDIKEIAQMDGAFIVSPDGIVERSRQIIEVTHEAISLSKGLGARHWAAAAITKKTKAVSVAVSQSNGTVRLFQNGELVLRIEPFDNAVRWQEFNYEPPPSDASD